MEPSGGGPGGKYVVWFNCHCNSLIGVCSDIVASWPSYYVPPFSRHVKNFICTSVVLLLFCSFVLVNSLFRFLSSNYFFAWCLVLLHCFAILGKSLDFWQLGTSFGKRSRFVSSSFPCLVCTVHLLSSFTSHCCVPFYNPVALLHGFREELGCDLNSLRPSISARLLQFLRSSFSKIFA